MERAIRGVYLLLLGGDGALNSVIDMDLRAQIRDIYDACFSTRNGHETTQTQFVGNHIDWDDPKFIGFYECE